MVSKKPAKLHVVDAAVWTYVIFVLQCLIMKEFSYLFNV